MIYQELQSREIQVWRSYLADNTQDLGNAFSCLNLEEKERAGSFYFIRDRDRFIRSRYLLKSLVASYVGKDTSEVRFEYNPYGKPALIANSAGLYFNISHAGDWVFMAFSKDSELGIDIEFNQEEDIAWLVGKDLFTDKELRYFSNLKEPNRRKLFYKLWTSKEACLKAIGSGFSMNPSDIEVDFIENKAVTLLKGKQASSISYCLIELENMPDRYVGFLAVPKQPAFLRYFTA